MSIADAVITDAHQHFWTKDDIFGLFNRLGVPLDSVELIALDFEPAEHAPPARYSRTRRGRGRGRASLRHGSP
mgnify:CR=1 FL=1